MEIEYNEVRRSLKLPYGELPLTDIPSAIVERLVAARGGCVVYTELFRVAWPDQWRGLDRPRALHGIHEHLSRVSTAARDLGAVALFGSIRGVGLSWAPIKEREEPAELTPRKLRTAAKYLMTLLLLLCALPCLAHSPEDTDPAMAPWFRSLATPHGSSCCNERDCATVAPTDLKIEDGSYWVRDPSPEDGGPAWMMVPAAQILKRYDNPTGKPVACVFSHHVLCFVLNSAT